MSQSFETFVPTLKHQKLLATVEAIALEKDKVEDTITLKQATEDAVKYFEQYRYWWINEGEMIFDRETRLLWQAQLDMNNGYSLEEARKKVGSLKIGGLTNWELPILDQLKHIAASTNFPLQHNEDTRIQGYDYWMTLSGRFDTDPSS